MCCYQPVLGHSTGKCQKLYFAITIFTMDCVRDNLCLQLTCEGDLTCFLKWRIGIDSRDRLRRSRSHTRQLACHPEAPLRMSQSFRGGRVFPSHRRGSAGVEDVYAQGRTVVSSLTHRIAEGATDTTATLAATTISDGGLGHWGPQGGASHQKAEEELDMERPKPPDGSAQAELERLLDWLEPRCEQAYARSAEEHDCSRAADTQVLADGLARVRQLRMQVAQLPRGADSGPGRDAAAALGRALLTQAAGEVLRWILHRIETSICSFTAAVLARLRLQRYAAPVGV